MVNYFIDHDYFDSEDTANTYTFTNGSTTVSAPGDQTANWAVDDFIRSNDATNGLVEWYRVTAVAYDSVNNVTNITIDHAFAQATHSAGAQKNSQYRLWKVDNGASGNGQSTTAAFCTPWAFLQIASAGDVGYVRRGKTYLDSSGVKWSIANDGAIDNFIVLKGDDGTGWATETGLAKPVLDIFQLDVYFDDYWQFEDLKIIGRNSSNAVSINNSLFVKLVNCDIVVDAAATSIDYCVYLSGASAELITCTFDSVTSGTGTGIRGSNQAVLIDCTFGQNLSKSIESVGGFYHRLIRCNLNNKPIVIYTRDGGYIELIYCDNVPVPTLDQPMTYVFVENRDGTHKLYMFQATIEKDTTNITGNATSSVKVTPTSNCNQNFPVKAFEWVVDGVTGGVSHTVSIDVLASGWTTLPTASELYIEVEYISDSTTLTTSTVTSTEAVTALDTWTTLSATFTPAADGRIRIRGYLTKYEANAYVVFNGEVNVT